MVCTYSMRVCGEWEVYDMHALACVACRLTHSIRNKASAKLSVEPCIHRWNMNTHWMTIQYLTNYSSRRQTTCPQVSPKQQINGRVCVWVCVCVCVRVCVWECVCVCVLTVSCLEVDLTGPWPRCYLNVCVCIQVCVHFLVYAKLCFL